MKEQTGDQMTIQATVLRAAAVELVEYLKLDHWGDHSLLPGVAFRLDDSFCYDLSPAIEATSKLFPNTKRTPAPGTADYAHMRMSRSMSCQSKYRKAAQLRLEPPPGNAQAVELGHRQSGANRTEAEECWPVKESKVMAREVKWLAVR